jgi:tRNA (guanosine-2'-O-)-methyltransferase
MTRFDAPTRQYLISSLKEMISEERWSKFREVLSYRTSWLTVVLEDIFQTHNASAVIRTCELSGIFNLHVIENQNQYNINPDIVVGSDKWIRIQKYNTEPHNTLQCYKHLRENGYRIVATSPHKDGYLLEELPLTQKTALIFGNEGFGLSQIALKHADAFVKIPSVGFTESYNISVSVALCLYHLTSRLRTSNVDWQLGDEEKEIIMLDYAFKSVRRPEILLRRLMSEYSNGFPSGI